MIPLLILLSTAWSFEEKEINNPILPIVLGQTYITKNHHIIYYHINVTQINHCLDKLQNSLDLIQKILSQEKTKDNFFILTKEKLKQTYNFLTSLKENTDLFTEKRKQKRGLINAVGKINKWLFGTLDNDDEQKYDSYISTLSKNQHTLNNEIKQSLSILSNVTAFYKNSILTIESNQLKIQEKISIIDTKVMSLSETLYLSLILGNINNELRQIKSIINI